MSAARLATTIRENPGACLYVYGDGHWELHAAEDANVTKPSEVIAMVGMHGLEADDLIKALAINASLNLQIC